MRKLTKKEFESLSKIRKETEESFATPAYKDYKIRYVKDPAEAEVEISRNHTAEDFLTIGVVALAKSLDSQDSSNEILVSHKSMSEAGIGEVYGGNGDGPKQMKENALLQVLEKVDQIFGKLYTGMPAMGAGINFCMCLTAHFSGVDMIPKEEVEDCLYFEYFDDVMSAQKKVFTLLKRIFSSCMAGMMAEMMRES